MEIPSKTDMSASDTSINSNNTGFPGSDYLDHPVKGNTPWSKQGTSDQDWQSASRDLQAQVELPTRESLKVKLVDSNLVYRFEEYRSEGSFFSAVFWALLGADIGIVTDLYTAIQPPFDPLQVKFLVALGIFTLVFGGISLRYSCKAKNKLRDIRASETSR
jgi:hypothetical protein